jgi:hypothetical protein
MSLSDNQQDKITLVGELVRRHWVTPSVTFLGDVKHLIRGGGKTGPNLDSDPQTTRKSGTG